MAECREDPVVEAAVLGFRAIIQGQRVRDREAEECHGNRAIAPVAVEEGSRGAQATTRNRPVQDKAAVENNGGREETTGRGVRMEIAREVVAVESNGVPIVRIVRIVPISGRTSTTTRSTTGTSGSKTTSIRLTTSK